MTLSAFTSFLGVIFTLSLILSLSWCETVSTTESAAAAEVDGVGADADVAAGKSSITPSKVAEILEAALKTAQDSLKPFLSADPLTFVNSLLTTAGTISSWFPAFVTAYQNVSALFLPNPPPDADAKIVLAALAKVKQHLQEMRNQDLGITLPSVNSRALLDFYKQREDFSHFFSLYSQFSELVTDMNIQFLVDHCKQYSMGIDLANWIEWEVTKPAGRLMDYYQDSCNYTELVGRARRLAGIFVVNAHLSSCCSGLRFPNSHNSASASASASANPEPDPAENKRSANGARDLDAQWEKVAKKLHENLMNKREFKNCRQVFTDSLDPYGKKNYELAHQKFATDLATYLYTKMPWINWYVLSFEQGVSGSTETSCVSGTLSICLQRQYGRNLFIAGQQAENNYFYSRNCPAYKDCIATLQQYKNCEDATKPFHECMKTKCKEPAGTICKRKSDDAAVEKGQSASADGWTKWNFGSGDKYTMHAVSP